MSQLWGPATSCCGFHVLGDSRDLEVAGSTSLPATQLWYSERL